jgi:large conductance mechanosensitive channel
MKFLDHIRQIPADFRALILRPTLVDMALGVVIGGAFLRVINSLINDVVMPILTWNPAMINPDNLLAAVFQFALVAVAVFMVFEAIKRLGVMHRPDTKKCRWCESDMPTTAQVCSKCGWTQTGMESEAIPEEGGTP